MTKEYIAYQGEQPLGIGTLEELLRKFDMPFGGHSWSKLCQRAKRRLI